jgi:two-component system, OmpR family, sensor histidine kinase KdpD
LNRFVANMLQMTRLESGHMQLRLEPQDLTEVVQATLELLRHPPRIEVRLPADLPLVQADFVLLQQALWNLLENALKFATSGIIEIGADVVGKDVELWVRDSGPGIPESERPLIYNRFYRGTTEIKGSGLGLPICQGVMQAMGGSIRMEDAAPGARFRLILKIAEL